MLTEDTADRLWVTNRLDPRQSILAGAKYLADLRDGLPAELPNPTGCGWPWRAYNGHGAHERGAGHRHGPEARPEFLV